MSGDVFSPMNSREEFEMRRSTYVAAIVTVTLGTFGALIGASGTPTPAVAQTMTTFDHLKCYGVRDGLKGQLYTADLVPENSIFTTEDGDRVEGGKLVKGCRITVPAKQFCTAVSKENATNVRGGGPPPGAAAGPDAGQFMCYRLTCPGDRVKQQLNVTDQFGSRSITVNDRPTMLCAPIESNVATPTPTPTGSPGGGTPTPTPVVTGTPVETATPTPTPVETATPTPTMGSPSGAFLDQPVF